MDTEDNRRSEFKKILLDLSNDQGILETDREREEIYNRLERLYYSKNTEKPFRHFYSDIFAVLTQLKADSKYGDINILGQNIAEIQKRYKAKNKDENGEIINIQDNIDKLYDHISLDIARIGYSDKSDHELLKDDTLKNISSEINSLNAKIQEAENKNKKITKKINNSQKEYIAILGIFAAIVLAFTTGTTFTASVLQNITQTNIYKIILVVLIIGLILINAVYGLLYYIDRLVEFHKEPKLKTLIISNITIFILIFADILAWNYGIVEKRNQNINAELLSAMNINCTIATENFINIKKQGAAEKLSLVSIRSTRPPR